MAIDFKSVKKVFDLSDDVKLDPLKIALIARIEGEANHGEPSSVPVPVLGVGDMARKTLPAISAELEDLRGDKRSQRVRYYAARTDDEVLANFEPNSVARKMQDENGEGMGVLLELLVAKGAMDDLAEVMQSGKEVTPAVVAALKDELAKARRTREAYSARLEQLTSRADSP